MIYQITSKQLEDIISKTYFVNKGDRYEIEYGSFIDEKFPHCETFWRYFVVPFTERIEIKNSISPRLNISEDIKDIAAFHYSMFLNLIYSHNHLQNFRLSSFEDFYMHLGSVCDLAEDFLLKTYLLILECKNQKSEILQELKKDDFLNLAGEWYDKKYKEVYDNYHKKGKQTPIWLLDRENVLDEYFKNSKDWETYKKYTRIIKGYRNIIVHDAQIGRLTTIKGRLFVPKKEKIQQYKKWSCVFAVRDDVQKLKKDFIDREEQMILDIRDLEIILNNLWKKPINDFKELFFERKNKILLKKYNIDLM